MLQGPLHESKILRYDVTIHDKAFQRFAQTATIKFYDESGRRVQSVDLGVIENEKVYALIDAGEAIQLNNCYLRDFSLLDYRAARGLGDHVPVKLHEIRARKTFFDGARTDFTHAVFEGDKTIFESAVFGNGSVDFDSAEFGNGDVVFRKARFGNGSISFRSARFGEGEVSFYNASFGRGDLNFVDADFGKGFVDFRTALFGDGHVDFKFAKFGTGDVSFEKAEFGNGKKDFKNVEFGGGKIDLKRVEFGDGDVSFEGVEFGAGRVNMRSSRFGEGTKNFSLADFSGAPAQFDYVDFGQGSISFHHARVLDISFRFCHLNAFLELHFSECRSLDLRNCVVRDILDVKPEGKTVIGEMNLSDMRILGRIFIGWRENDVKKLIYNQTQSSYYQKAEQFRILKENFRNNGQYDDEDSAYIEFRRCEARARLESQVYSKKTNGLWAYPVYYFQHYLFDFVGRYATAPVRVLGNSAIAVLFFALLYFGFTNFFPSIGRVGTSLPPEMDHSSEFFNCIYYSTITFSTVGYGDYFAIGLVKLMAAFEGFSGIFLMSYFTVAFVRKILR